MEVAGVHLTAPDGFDLCDHVSLGGRKLVGQLVLHNGPAVLDGVEVRGVPWPLDHPDVLLLEEVPDQVCGVAGSAVLEEPVAAMTPHEAEEVLVQHLAVPHRVHGDLLQEEEQPSSSFCSGERSPGHDRGRVLDSWRAEFWIQPSSHWPPDQLDPVPDELERRLVREHDLAPVLLRPVAVPSAEVEPAPHHPVRQQWLPRSPAARHAQRLLAGALDGPQGDPGVLDDPAPGFDVSRSREGMIPHELTESSQHCRSPVGDTSRASLPLDSVLESLDPDPGEQPGDGGVVDLEDPPDLPCRHPRLRHSHSTSLLRSSHLFGHVESVESE